MADEPHDSATLIEALPPATGGALAPTRPTEAQRPSYNPATGELLGYVPLVGREGVEAAVRAARAAQPDWAARPPRERAQLLTRFQHLVVEEQEALGRLIHAEQGKPETEAILIELVATLGHQRWLAREGAQILEGKKVPTAHPLGAAKKARYQYDPLGVVAVISPWNYPFALAAGPALTALMAGNAVVLKPSPDTPLVAQRLGELLRRAGLPAGLLTVLHIEDRDAPTLTSHPGVDKIVFTGSVVTGRKVMASAAQVPTPVVLELGGKDAALVAPDADLRRAVPGIAWYAMTNAGQTCAAVERVYVHEALYERFVEETVALVRGLSVGEGGSVGPLTNAQQLRIVEEQVEEARTRGARVLVGGQRVGREGFFYAPTVLVDVTPDMRIMQEESFGPVLPIVRVATMEEALREANSLPYALTGSVWSGNLERGMALAAQIRAGAVNVNDHAYHFGEPAAGWGGVGQSGFGRTHGVWGLMEMVNPKFLSADPSHGPEAWWYPYDERAAHLVRNATRFLYGAPPRRPWALLSLLLNPRLWQRMNVARFASAWRRWL